MPIPVRGLVQGCANTNPVRRADVRPEDREPVEVDSDVVHIDLNGRRVFIRHYQIGFVVQPFYEFLSARVGRVDALSRVPSGRGYSVHCIGAINFPDSRLQA